MKTADFINGSQTGGAGNARDLVIAEGHVRRGYLICAALGERNTEMAHDPLSHPVLNTIDRKSKQPLEKDFTTKWRFYDSMK